LYKRPDGKWILAPWDVDKEYGNWRGADASFYNGEENDPSRWVADWWNRLLDAYFKAFKADYDKRLRELDRTLLDPAALKAIVDKRMAAYNRAEAGASPVGVPCNVDAEIALVKKFFDDRRATLRARLGQ
jgi:hypothetical protein